MIITTVFISLNIEYTGARYTCTYVSKGMHEKSKSLNVPESYCWAIRHITNSTFKISVNYKWGRHMNSIILSDWTDRNWRVQKTKYTYFSSDSKPCLFIKMCTLYVICLDFSKTITIGFFFFIYVMSLRWKGWECLGYWLAYSICTYILYERINVHCSYISESISITNTIFQRLFYIKQRKFSSNKNTSNICWIIHRSDSKKCL